MIVTDLDQLSDPLSHDPDKDHRAVAKRLQTVLDDVGGLGLSANQIGVEGSRTCLVSVQENIFFVNPRIVSRRQKTETREGCLSIPNTRLRTERDVWVEVEADAWFVESVGEWNEIGGRLSFGPDVWADHMEDDDQWKTVDKDYLESIAVQHEIDHLNGKTIYDREVQQDPFEKSELDALGRNDKVHVRNSEDEEFDVKWKYAQNKIARRNEDGPWTLLEVNEN